MGVGQPIAHQGSLRPHLQVDLPQEHLPDNPKGNLEQIFLPKHLQPNPAQKHHLRKLQDYLVQQQILVQKISANVLRLWLGNTLTEVRAR